MLNFAWILDGRLAGSGFVFPEEGAFLLEQGIRAILSLTERDPASGQPFPDAIRQIHLPISDFAAPDPGTRDRAMAFIDESLTAQRPVLVHCAAGYGRTGTILACYLVHTGIDPDEAVRAVRALRPGSIETRDQEQAIRAYGAERRRGTA